MFTKKTPADKPELDKAITDALLALDAYPKHSEEYAAIVDQLTKLYAMKAETPPSRVSADVLATVAANLVGIAIIVGYEQKHVMTSKALTFIKLATR